MYEFWYDYVKPKHNEKAKLCYRDIFIVYIKTNDIYIYINININIYIYIYIHIHIHIYIYKDIAEDVKTIFYYLNYELTCKKT